MDKKDKKDKKNKDKKDKDAKKAAKKQAKEEKKRQKQQKKMASKQKKGNVAVAATQVYAATPHYYAPQGAQGARPPAQHPAGAGGNIARLCDEQTKLAGGLAAQWGQAGRTPGLLIWRIEKFKVVPWPPANYGQFFTGDSYIVLNTYQRGNALGWDIHFWLGENTTQDEAGTAAYKTVELDNYLGGAPVEHREVQGYESQLFLSYFSARGGITYIEGGIESGFKHVEDKTYPTRLFQVKGTQNVRVTQVELSASSLNSGDVFILDTGMKIWQWNGRQSSPNEKAKAGQICRAMKSERGGKPELINIDEGHPEQAELLRLLGGDEDDIMDAEEGGDDAAVESFKKLLRLSDASGTLQITPVAEKIVRRNQLDSKDVFILDVGYEIFVWIGKQTSPNEKAMAMKFAQDYLQRSGRPPYLPISRIVEGGENPTFTALLD